uniref:Uncharacterized protein n=1 Tax=Megaselia scalaris TaxID=36166 RepID=T1GMW8_MEGSC
NALLSQQQQKFSFGLGKTPNFYLKHRKNAILETKEETQNIMATLEKPKSKKQKKKVVGEDFEGITPEPEPEYSSSTAACSKLVSYECAVSKEFHTVKEEDFEEETPPP